MYDRSNEPIRLDIRNAKAGERVDAFGDGFCQGTVTDDYYFGLNHETRIYRRVVWVRHPDLLGTTDFIFPVYGSLQEMRALGMEVAVHDVAM